ncbi:MAG: sigma-70 family RNA polymerase sigma factor [Chloroflexota bacterium]|nr:sigma-70 family RNA polymerase sigma factor [Chloroflexota bacterium]
MNQPGTSVPGRLASAADDADRATLDRIAAGEDGAIEILYERYKSMAYALALRITGDAALAEDVLQDAFVGAWRNAARYDQGRGSVKTWLLSIVHHRAIDATRRRRPTTELPDSDAATPTPLTLPDVWAEVAGRLDRDAIVAALGTLSDVQREALELGYFGGLTQQEIAEQTGTPLGTVKSRMRLGLQAMRRVLTGDESVAGADGTAPA